MRILLAEDERSLSKAVKSILTKNNYSVDTVYENTYLATQKILKELNKQGYEVVTVSELLGDPRPAVKYSKA